MMKAYRLMQWKTPARLVDVPVPESAPGQVLIKVGGNGICQSDLHFMHDWEASPPHLDIRLPMTVGHEIGGWIETCGPGVTGLEPGLPCLVTLAGCGHCKYCAAGWNNYCPNKLKVPGMGLDGGLAEYTVAPAAAIVPLQSLEPWQAAPLTDAGLSAYHAVRRVLPQLVAGSTAVVIGVGGLGHMAVTVLKAVCPARIIAVDTSEKALTLAKDLGADSGVVSDSTAAEAIRAETSGRGVEAVLDFVGAGATMGLAAKVIRPLGHIVVVGRGHGTFEFKDHALPYGAAMSTTFGGSKLELMHLVALAEAGVIKPHVTRYSLSEVETAFEMLRKGEIVGRVVVVPNGQ
jgi:propanol-preferring alcohol dehydrogenase